MSPGTSTSTSTSKVNDWYRDAVIYELHVRAFADSNGDGIGDFNGLTSRLDYLADLGVTALWLLPFYPSPRRDDGYDIADYFKVNPEYGNLRAFQRFLDAAHARDLRVITELVINHTSDQHPWFQAARRAPEGSSERDFYVWSDDPNKWPDARIIFQDFETSNWTWDPVAKQYFWHRFYSHQPDLNFDNPAVEEAVLKVLDHWLDMGVDGLRLDAIPYLFEREGTNCENLPETHATLKRIRAHMDSKYEGRMLLAEANMWPEDSAAYFGDDDECHMNFHFPVMPRLFMSVQMENRTPIVDILDQTPTPPGNAQWATFLRNHDELTLEMVTDEERDVMLRAYARDSEMRINLGIRRRLAPLLGNDRRKIELLNAILFSLPGTPVLYYGDEIGMGDNVYLGDRDGVRTPMHWSADRNAGFSTANPHRLFLPLVTEQQYHYESVNVENQTSNPSSLLSWMRQLIALRKRQPVLGRGDLTFLEPDNPHVLAFVRRLEGEPPLLCVANLSRLAQHVQLDLRELAGTTPVEVFGRTNFAPIREEDYHLTLAPYGYFWLSLERSAAEVAAADGDAAIVHLPGTMTEVLRRRSALTRALGSWMPRRRWFAGKGRTVRELSIDDVFVIAAPKSSASPSLADAEVALVTVRVAYTDGDDQRYAVPLMRVGPDHQAGDRPTAAVIAKLDDGHSLIDAMSDQRGVAVLVSAALGKRTHDGRRGQAVGRPLRRGLTRAASDPRNIHVLSVEQSNSSAIVGGELIAKLIRRLEPGLNPDVELPLHLAGSGFSNAPRVVGTLDVDLAGEQEAANAVVVHDVVHHESDLWVWMLDELSLAIDHGVPLPPESAPDAPPPASMTIVVAELLGRRTAELHRHLAGLVHDTPAGNHPAALTAEPFSLHWQRSILQTVRSSLRATQRELGRRSNVGAMSEIDRKRAQLLADRSSELLERFDRLRTAKVDAKRMRIHGDLHLGQVLWTGHDVTFIDFEGEPGIPIGQRRIKRSPLGDVAGLLRSLDYAGRVAVHTADERGRIGPSDLDAVHRWRAEWTAAAQRALLDTYLDRIDGTDLIPADRADVALLLDVYTLTKCLYEVRYELANRPHWVGWPLAAIADMFPARRP